MLMIQEDTFSKKNIDISPFHWCKNAEDVRGSAIVPVDLATKYGLGPVSKLLRFYFPSLEKRIPSSYWKELQKNGLAEPFKLSEDEVVKILRSKRKQKVPEIDISSIKNCEWCNSETYILHKHHYPVRKKSGGESVVRICASCHAEFHWLSDRILYRPTKEVSDAFEKSLKYREKCAQEFDKMKGVV